MTNSAIYEPKSGGVFAVERLSPGLVDRNPKYVTAIRRILEASWTAKFVPEHMTAVDLGAKLVSNSVQRERIVTPTRDAAYWLAYRPIKAEDGEYDLGLRHVNDACAFVRVETYKPRNPFKKAYSNITDVETLDGKIRGTYEKQVAALLHFALADFEDDRKASFYGEEPNDEAVRAMGRLGYDLTDDRPTEKIGAATMTYVHMEANAVERVKGNLMLAYPFLGQPAA